jgi:hypothetical protein
MRFLVAELTAAPCGRRWTSEAAQQSAAKFTKLIDSRIAGCPVRSAALGVAMGTTWDNGVSGHEYLPSHGRQPTQTTLPCSLSPPRELLDRRRAAEADGLRPAYL